MLSTVGEGGGGLGGSTAGFRLPTSEADVAAAAGKKGSSGASQKPAAASSKKGGKERKLVSDYKETASTSQPNAMDTMRPTAGRWDVVSYSVGAQFANSRCEEGPFCIMGNVIIIHSCISLPGVTLRSGTQSKAGPQKARDKDRDSAVGLTMTRDEFQKHVAAR